MIVTNVKRKSAVVTDDQGVTYHIPPHARNLDCPTVTDEASLPKGVIKVGDSPSEEE